MYVCCSGSSASFHFWWYAGQKTNSAEIWKSGDPLSARFTRERRVWIAIRVANMHIQREGKEVLCCEPVW